MSVSSDRCANVGHTFASLLDNSSTNSQEHSYLAVKNDELDANDSRQTQTTAGNCLASELLFQILADFMQRVRSKLLISSRANLNTNQPLCLLGQPTLSAPTITVMSMLLKCSQPARAAATANGFLGELIKELNEVYAKFGMACSEFIRRYGDSKVFLVFSYFYDNLLKW